MSCEFGRCGARSARAASAGTARLAMGAGSRAPAGVGRRAGADGPRGLGSGGWSVRLLASLVRLVAAYSFLELT